MSDPTQKGLSLIPKPFESPDCEKTMETTNMVIDFTTAFAQKPKKRTKKLPKSL